MATPSTVHEVFTPAARALLNFVPRNAVDDQLLDALRTPGRQLIVYGESGSGKSTLLAYRLIQEYKRYISTQCMSSTSCEQLLFDAFDQLDQYYVSGETAHRSQTVSSSLVADFFRIKASINANLTQGAGETRARVVPPQLTPQRLAEFLGAKGMCWVVEDFHKMEISQKRLFAEWLKVFNEASFDYPRVRIIAIGAADTGREIVEYDSNMRNRVSELYVPLMDDDELSQIIVNGQQLLNVDLTALVAPIVQYSVGVPSVCHELALNACVAKGVLARVKTKKTFSADDLEAAVQRYVRISSDTLKVTFERAMQRHRTARFDNYRLILQVLAAGPLAGMSRGDLLAGIQSYASDYTTKQLPEYLRALTKEDRGQILKAGLDGRYRFSEPIYHTFAQLTLLNRAQRVASQSEQPVAEWVAAALDQLIKNNPALELVIQEQTPSGSALLSIILHRDR
jgi:hypothetical protein